MDLIEGHPADHETSAANRGNAGRFALQEMNPPLLQTGMPDRVRGKILLNELPFHERIPDPGHLQESSIRANEFGSDNCRPRVLIHPAGERIKGSILSLCVTVQEQEK